MTHVNFYVVNCGGARASVLVAGVVVWMPTPANLHPQLRVVYDKFVDYGY